MNICVIGAGYVGLTIGVCLASKKHDVTCVDIMPEKVKKINNGESPIYEEGLEELLKNVLRKKSFRATTNLKKAVKDAKIVFICVGTPSRKDGSIKLNYIKKASEELNNVIRDEEYRIIVVKSTVVPGTTMNMVKPRLKNKNVDFCMNPEFLREGRAVSDYLNPDKIVLGCETKNAEKLLKKVYKNFNAEEIILTNPTTAEMIKYANNSFLATKISFANEVGNMCKKLGISVYDVMDSVGRDKRIERRFLNAGAGFGGSCFPKDVKALIARSKDLEVNPELLETVIRVNEEQPYKLVELLKKKYPDLRNKKVGILGLSFKPGTDDIREAPSRKIIRELLDEKAEIIVYDPKATKNIKNVFGNRIKYSKNGQEVINKSNIVLIVTEWDEFKKLDYKDKLVIDGRHMNINAENYEGLCW